MRTQELDAAAFQEMKKQPFAVIDCYGDACFACKLLEPIFDEVASKLPEIAFGRINLTRCGSAAEGLDIMAFPTLLFFRQGELVHRKTGSLEAAALMKEIGVMLYE